MKKLTLFITITFITTSVFAHSGRTNKDGCHNNNKDGSYHCH